MARGRALFPGSFDPPTRGHQTVLSQACRVFSEVLVALAVRSDRQTLFSVTEREELLGPLVAQFPQARLVRYDGLTAQFARQHNVDCVVRGLRNERDLAYERELALGNARLGGGLPTVFFLALGDEGYISARLVREVIAMGGVEAALPFVPLCCHQVLKQFAERRAEGDHD